MSKSIIRGLGFGLLSSWAGSAVFAAIIGTQLALEFGHSMLTYMTLFIGGSILSSMVAVPGGPLLALTVRWLSLKGLNKLPTSLLTGLIFGLVGSGILSVVLLIVSSGKISQEVYRAYTILISGISLCLAFWVSYKVSMAMDD